MLNRHENDRSRLSARSFRERRSIDILLDYHLWITYFCQFHADLEIMGYIFRVFGGSARVRIVSYEGNRALRNPSLARGEGWGWDLQHARQRHEADTAPSSTRTGVREADALGLLRDEDHSPAQSDARRNR
eukprot:COSAG02_NODE_2632_length_8381_cov_1.693552_4_plen_131_part_00